MSKKNLTDIVKKTQSAYAEDKRYAPLPIFSPEEIQTMEKEPHLFFFASRYRVILVIDILKNARALFEKFNYTDVVVSIELYNYAREYFNTRALNKNLYVELWKNKKILSYDEFLSIENEYISEFNKKVNLHSPTVTHINFKFEEPDKNIIEELDAIFSNKRHRKILTLRSQGKTLDQVGEELNVTRERIRQLELIPKKNLLRWLNANSEEVRKAFCIDNRLIKERVCNKLGADVWEMIKYVIKTSKNINANNWYYFEIIDSYFYFPGCKNIDEVRMRFRKEEKIFVECNLFAKAKEMFVENLKNAGFKFMTPEFVEQYLESDSFRIHNEKTYNKRLTLGQAIKLVVKTDFPNGINLMDKKELAELYKLLEKRYDLHSCKGRALSARAEEVLVMRNKGFYDLPEKVKCSDELKEYIISYILSAKEEMLPYTILFDRIKDKLLKESNIDNPYYLHGVLRKWSKTDKRINCLRYYVGKASSSEAKSEVFFKQLNDYLLKKGRPASVEEITKDLPFWNLSYMKYSLLYFKDIIPWGPTAFAHKKALVLSKQDLFKVNKILSDLTTNKFGYTSIHLLHAALKENFPEFLEKYLITNNSNLFYLVSKNLEDEYFFSSPHIVNDPSLKSYNEENFVKLLLDQKVVNKKDALDIIQKYFGKPNALFSKALAKGLEDFYKVGPNLYVAKKEIKVDKNKLKKIKEFVASHISQNTFLLPIHLKDLSLLPDIGFAWSPWLLCEIVRNYDLGFNVVRNKNVQQGNLILGIVTKESKIETKEELFRWLMANDYTRPRTKDEIIKYARKTGLFGNSFTWNILENMLSTPVGEK